MTSPFFLVSETVTVSIGSSAEAASASAASEGSAELGSSAKGIDS